MAFQLPALMYPHNALEPHIDALTMEIHHGKHHQAYINNLNTAVAGTSMDSMFVEELISNIGSLPKEKQMAVRNNGGGHYNHSFFWKVLSPKGGGQPAGELSNAINSTYGSFDEFKSKFTTAGTGRFGSGWVWLVSSQGKLTICSTPNQDNPLMYGLVETNGIPLIGLDVWEHAYYLKYQNRRPDYINAFWNLVDWGMANDYFKKSN
ncbi:MAG: superoxide dismutase [Bacteroidetes bacterium RIFCSPLOWO2_02_FULL_36_8]|nr:MAG: superoxide dismutase [Bacteroidetes bacterium RIFCSPLOWO2_02_FULL_36_8]OFY70232.1 MAG: superoxide dismutase [Bacteroidetes bacterium RIFCSPLOWO2_12_FULL_37_12]